MSKIQNSGIHFHLETVEDISGFPPTNVNPGNYFWLLTRASITSDEPEFYKYVEQISNPFFTRCKILQDAVYQFLILIHEDLSAELFINDFPIEKELLAKRDFKAAEAITDGDIADIRRLKFSNIQIADTDKVIYCFKVGWKFGLFFDLDRREKSDIDGIWLALGKLYRELLFQHVYEVLRTRTQFEEMLKDGWFPFVQLLGWHYKALSEAYKDKFDFDNRIEKVVGSFDREAIEKITANWWKKQIFQDKKELIQAGINAFLSFDNAGYINCIKTLLTEAEGIIRLQHFEDTGKDKNVRVTELLDYLIERRKTKSGSEHSLLLPLPFLEYLKNVVFSRFDLASGQVDLSRNSSSHGVAPYTAYTRTRALQGIFILDQIYFYL